MHRRTMGGYLYRSFVVPVVIASVLQSGRTSPAVECPKSSVLLSLVGVTMCSTNDLPFDWASDYEVAVVYVTSTWSSEFVAGAEDSSAPVAIAQNGFLNYCVRFKTRLAAWAESLQRRPDVNDLVKKIVSNWYRAVDNLSQNNWTLPDVRSLESFGKQFRTAYKHLVINGAEVYESAETGTVKRDVDGFVKGIANMLIGTLRDVSKQVRDVPKKNDAY